ncbi:MAG TPA: hypothetical protein VET90_01395 [Candidatus Binatus sp.]|nr:hypothetical protein [Candidatus Binatus sp.]
MTWGAAMTAAFLATTGRGRWWLTALATFLVRGGVLALLPAILVTPTPAELALHLDPSLTGDAPGAVTPALVELALGTLVIATIVLLATTALGTWLEGRLIEAVTEGAELAPISSPYRLPLGPGVVARLVPHLPTLAAVVIGGLAIAEAAYGEFVSPSAQGSLTARVFAQVPWAFGAIVVSWLLGEAWGGSAVRRLARAGPLLGSIRRGLVDVARPSGLATLGLSSAAVALPAAVLWLAASSAYDRLWPLVLDRADPWSLAFALCLLVATWGAGLWLLAIGLAFRSVAWTAEHLRRT